MVAIDLQGARELADEEVRHYLFEVLEECDIVADSWKMFQRAAEIWIEAHHTEPWTGEVLRASEWADREMVIAVEGILGPSARVSQFFFPTNDTGPFGLSRGARLQRETGMAPQHKLSERLLRNHWMHLDHRLDRGLRLAGEVPIGRLVRRHSNEKPDTVRRTFRLVDPTTATVYVYGVPYSLESIVEAAMHANELAVTALFGAASPDDLNATSEQRYPD